MTKKTSHGGKREGAGRKPAVDGQVRDQVFSVRLTAKEKALLDSTQAKDWARDVLLKSAKRRQIKRRAGESNPSNVALESSGRV
jgi:hypothetical protein